MKNQFCASGGNRNDDVSTISIHIQADILQKLDRVAEARGLCRNELINFILRCEMNNGKA